MKGRFARISIVVLVAGGLVAAIALGLRAAAPGWIRGAIERSASRALARELKINGAVELSLSLTPSLSASDVSLANAAWGTEPSMVVVGRVVVSVKLWSLWSGPLRVVDLAVDDVRVLLERGADGLANWAFDLKPAGGKSSFVVEHAALRGLELVYRARPDARPLRFGVRELDAGLHPGTLEVDVRGAGHFGDAPWDVAGRLGPLESVLAAKDVTPALTGHIGQAAFSMSGRIHDPLKLGGPNVEISIDGPDIVDALGVFDLKSPLTGPFHLGGRLSPAADEVGVELNGGVGGVTASAQGTVSALLRPDRIDARVEASGPDAAVVGAWTRVVGLPRRPFDLAGRLKRDGSRLSFDDLRIRAGGTSLTVSGTLGALPRCVGTDLAFAATGTDLSELSALTRLRLPPGTFRIGGRFLRRTDGLAIDGVELNTHDATIQASGTIGEPPRLDNLDLTAEGSGPDASFLSGVARIDLPPEPFEIGGRVARSGPALTLDEVAGRLGEDAFAITGPLIPVRGLVGTDVRVRLTGPDAQRVASLAGLNGVPAQPYEVVGSVRVATDHVALDDVDASVGGLTVRMDGTVGTPTPRSGTSLLCRAHGAALSELAAWGVPVKLPPDPFAVSGRLDIDEGLYRVEGVSAEIGMDRLAVDGTLGALPDIAALDLGLTASGPRLADLARFAVAEGKNPPPRIPAAPFTVTGRVRRTTSGIELLGIKGGVGNATLDADGLLGFENRWIGTDVTVAVDAPDTVMLSEVAGTDFPEGALRASGRIRSTPEGLHLDGAELAVGALFAQLTGLVGRPPNLAGTAINLSVEGPSLATALAPWTGAMTLPTDSFALSAHVTGSLDRLTSERFTARLGDSDLSGSLTMDLTGRPSVDADLSSKNFDVSRLVAGFTREPEVEETAGAPAKKARDKREHLIPDWPLELGALRAFDARLNVTAAEVPFPAVPIRDVIITGVLQNGALTIDRADGTGRNGGRMTSSFSMRPEGDGYRLLAEGSIQGGRLAVSKAGESAESAPSLEVNYHVEGAGRSLHEIAAASSGLALVVLGPGRIPNTLIGGNSSATFVSLMDALNPFRKSTPYTALECGVAAAAIEDGMMAVEPIAVRGDKLTVVGKGKVNLETEAIDLSWTIKPRRNVGLSPGSIANPYIRLGGTLAAPHLDVKPLEAIASTGAAVATAGLTILFRGIYNRITAEKKVCVQALAKAQKQRDEFEKRKSPAPDESPR